MKSKAGFALIAAGILLSPLFSSGQHAPVPADKKLQAPQETFGDAYLHNAYQNKKTSPAYKYKSGAVKRMLNSSCCTIQVNVDASGQNILGDAANEPSIAVNPLNADMIVIGWRQFDNVSSNFRQAGWSYTTNAGQTWISPGVIQPGIFRSDPVLDFDSSGNFYYNSLTINPDYFCKVFKSTDGGATWDNGTDAQGGDKQWMTIDRTTGGGSGNIYSFWTSNFSTCLPGFFTRSTNGNISYENCIPVNGQPFWGTMAVGNNGELYICGASQSGPAVVKSLNAQVPASTIIWEPSVPVFLDGDLGYQPSVNPGGLLGQASIDVDRSNGPGHGNVYLLASVVRTANSDPGDVMFARSTDGGLTWSLPVRINDDASVSTQWFGTMSVAPNGRIDAVWLDTRDNPGSDLSALYYSYSTDQGNTWSANEIFSGIFDPHVGYPNQNKMGDYFDMISDNSGAHFAWANTLNGEENVYYSHIIPPIVTGVNEPSDKVIISVFPNPTPGVFFIVNAAKQSHIEISNVLGEKVFSSTILQTITQLNISTHPAGIYFLKIVSRDGSTVVKKIIRE